MCLVVYLGTTEPPDEFSTQQIGLDPVRDSEVAVRQWFSLPVTRTIGIPAGNCSCDFRQVLAEEEVEWFQEMWEDDSPEVFEIQHRITSLLRAILQRERSIELYAIWSGQESDEPRWRVEKSQEWFDPERFFVQERMFYRVTHVANV